MTAKEYFQNGKVREAIQALGAELRDNPGDAKRRTFLFELLSFAGEYDRAEKHLNVLASGNGQAELGAVMYLSALHAERMRQEMFDKESFPTTPAEEAGGGTLNGASFQNVEDADARIGPRLELFAAGAYLWLPFTHIESIEVEAPRRLRDTLWAPAIVKTGPAFNGQELGQVLLPVISPASCRNADGHIQLGQTTEWVDGVPLGQKMLTVDGEDIPFLEIRKLEFNVA